MSGAGDGAAGMPSDATDTFDFERMKERVEMGLSERHDKGWLLKHNIMKGTCPRWVCDAAVAVD